MRRTEKETVDNRRLQTVEIQFFIQKPYLKTEVPPQKSRRG